jgi:hypothetical protein
MILTKKHKEKIKHECRMYLMFDENYICSGSKYMWNNYQIRVKSYFKKGELDRYEIIKPPNNN